MAAQTAAVSIIPAALVVYAAMMPAEVRITLAGQSFFAWRLVGIALLPWIIFGLRHNPISMRFWDILVGLAVFWILFAFMAYYGPADGVLRGGALSIDIAIPYLIGRASIRNLTDLRKLLLLVAPALGLVALSMISETLASGALVRPAFEKVFGSLPRYEGGEVVSGAEDDRVYDTRLGLIRVAGPFSHPILAGLFMLSFLPLFLQSGLRRWPFFVGIAASLSGVLSLSSAAFLMLNLGVGMAIADRIRGSVTFVRWPMIITPIVFLLAAVHFGSEKGIINVIGRYTLDPATAHFRELIWQFGTNSVMKNPWIGIGYDNYERLDWMVSSVDNNWLLSAIRFGIVPPFAILGAILAVIIVLARKSTFVGDIDRRFYVGISITLFSMTMLGFTVAFFGGFPYWFYLLLGAAGSIAAVQDNPQRPAVERPVLRPVDRRR